MNTTQIEDSLKRLVISIDETNFIYDFLCAYGISKTSIARLRKGDFNLSKVEGEVLYKNKIFFRLGTAGKLLFELEEFSEQERILKCTPRFIILTDFESIVARDLKTKLNRDFKISDLPKYFDFFLPLTGAEIYKSSNDNKADRDAAYKMAQLYDILVTDNEYIYNKGSHELNLFLSRLLFCFFAEDTGIFNKKSIFTETLSLHTTEDGANVHDFLDKLFRRLSIKEADFPDYLLQFPYVNGGLFKDTFKAPKFTKRSRNLLMELGELDWSEINPDIFGSMIQAVADPQERSDLGMHYTSIPNIKKLIEPLFLNELYENFYKNYESSNNLKKLINRISKIKFFDPACGSGNFLIITYKEIRLLEIKIIQRLVDLAKEDSQLMLFFTSVSLLQFYGIEIKDFAHEMAILSLWLAEHQMNKIFEDTLDGYGQSEDILPLKAAGKIVCTNAIRSNWEEICPRTKDDEIYILGNPPYLGARMQEESQKNDMDLVFGHLNKYRDLDYIACWFLKAKNYIMGYNAKFAFVSTSSITQGQQVALLWPYVVSDGIEIYFAYSSFKWTNNAKGIAGVSVVIIGLRNNSNELKHLYSEKIKKTVKNINAYLIDSNNIYIYERSTPISNIPKMHFGNMPNDGGALILSENEKDELIHKYPQALSFIRTLIGSYEFINGEKRYCLWIDDSNLEAARGIPLIYKRINASREHRLSSKDKGTNKLASRPHQFRDRNVGKESQLIVPSVSSERREYIPIGFLDAQTIISNLGLVVYDPEPWLFGVLQSKMHMTWVKAVGGKLKMDYRYSAKLCYNTFPFPDLTTKQKETINQYVFQILDERAKYSEKTMAWLYNPDTMPNRLRTAHKEMDEAIDRVYRLSQYQSDIERLEYLFKLHEEMSQRNTLFEDYKKARTKKLKIQ